ncbi:MAG: M23 family metallopeptidase, partial [Deltaproteobacteria bacterium]|nr:M23 family metallopeptidase [Deltaproteobacteria bacterium]
MHALHLTLLSALLLLPSHGLAGRARGAKVKAPWKARVHVTVGRVTRSFGLIDPDQLPPEPEAPKVSSPRRFARALHIVCDGRIGKKTARRYARWIRKYSEHFEVDPFVVSAFIRRQSGCLRAAKGKNGVGLTRIPVSAHSRHIREGRYHYRVHDGSTWRRHELDVSKFPWSRASLRKAENAIYFASALLAVYGRQADSLKRAFRQNTHRHLVSHLIWGDRARANNPEERVMRDRRRMIAYYTGKHSKSKGNYRGRRFRLPLDGAPRKITSGYHGRRGKRKRRKHRSLDFYSHIGEPVRAIDKGKVRFAGYQPRRGRSRRVSPKASGRIKERVMGRGGLFVIIDHKGGLQSGYFHLKDFAIRSGQRVRKGQF